MARSRRRDTGASAPKGTARRTLRAARFFFDQAGRIEPHDSDYHEYYVEAAIVFAWMAFEHLEKEFRGKRGAEKWIKNLQEGRPLIRDLRKKRNSLSHERPIGIIPSQTDDVYSDEPSLETREAHEMLSIQLEEIEAVVNQCEKLFK